MSAVIHDTALVLYYDKPNRYGFNVLVGALEGDEYFNNLNVYLVEHGGELASKLGGVIERHEKVIVGFSFFTTQLWDVCKLIKKLRRKYADRALYVAGGPHPTGDPEGTLRMGFDVVVRGEGEETLAELLKRFDCDEGYADVKGVAYFDGEYRFTGWRPPVNLDRYPPFAARHGMFGPIEITRGCPFACYFCQTPRMFGSRVRHRSVEQVCRYVEVMRRRGLTDVRFTSPNAFSYGSPDGKRLNVARLEELLEGVREAVGPKGRLFIGSFPSEVRPEHVTEETVELVLKYASNDNLVIGAQSGSQRVLDACHRGHSVEDVYNAVKLTLKAGLKANVDFIFGLPGETEEDAEQTIKVMKELAEMGARIHAHTFMPLPQTPFAKAPAGRVSGKLRKAINSLICKGKVYGAWERQEKIAEMIERYMRTGDVGCEGAPSRY